MMIRNIPIVKIILTLFNWNGHSAVKKEVYKTQWDMNNVRIWEEDLQGWDARKKMKTWEHSLGRVLV